MLGWGGSQWWFTTGEGDEGVGRRSRRRGRRKSCRWMNEWTDGKWRYYKRSSQTLKTAQSSTPTPSVSVVNDNQYLSQYVSQRWVWICRHCFTFIDIFLFILLSFSLIRCRPAVPRADIIWDTMVGNARTCSRRIKTHLHFKWERKNS